MFSRLLKPPKRKSFFLFGPRGTGKTFWVKSEFPKAVYIDLLESSMFATLVAELGRLEDLIPSRFEGYIIIDGVQYSP